MISPLLLFDVGVPGGEAGLAAVGIGFFLILLAAAYVVFRLLRKTLKMAFRIAIFAIILLIAVVGSLSLLYIGVGNSGKPRPGPSRQR
jgi:hypothetical protein